MSKRGKIEMKKKKKKPFLQFLKEHNLFILAAPLILHFRYDL